jgi:hypothetical protein
MPTLISSGFQAKSTIAVAPQALEQPTILDVKHGKNGQLLLQIKRVAKARIYQVRFGVVGAGGALPASWSDETFASARAAAPVNGLTPGTNYAFQVRAFGKLGWTDWSETFTQICA